jgi:hypothetical protein
VPRDAIHRRPPATLRGLTCRRWVRGRDWSGLSGSNWPCDQTATQRLPLLPSSRSAWHQYFDVAPRWTAVALPQLVGAAGDLLLRRCRARAQGGRAARSSAAEDAPPHLARDGVRVSSPRTAASEGGGAGGGGGGARFGRWRKLGCHRATRALR